MSKYVIDSNVLIDAKNWHFPMDSATDFWDWLLTLGKDYLLIPEEVQKEIGTGKDDLSVWLHTNKVIFACQTRDCLAVLPNVMAAYGTPTETDLEKLNADPYVIAHAMVLNAFVVTGEQPKATTVVKNKKIPNICASLGIKCLTLPALMWEMRHTMP